MDAEDAFVNLEVLLDLGEPAPADHLHQHPHPHHHPYHHQQQQQHQQQRHLGVFGEECNEDPGYTSHTAGNSIYGAKMMDDALVVQGCSSWSATTTTAQGALWTEGQGAVVAALEEEDEKEENKGQPLLLHVLPSVAETLAAAAAAIDNGDGDASMHQGDTKEMGGEQNDARLVISRCTSDTEGLEQRQQEEEEEMPQMHATAATAATTATFTTTLHRDSFYDLPASPVHQTVAHIPTALVPTAAAAITTTTTTSNCANTSPDEAENAPLPVPDPSDAYSTLLQLLSTQQSQPTAAATENPRIVDDMALDDLDWGSSPAPCPEQAAQNPFQTMAVATPCTPTRPAVAASAPSETSNVTTPSGGSSPARSRALGTPAGPAPNATKKRQKQKRQPAATAPLQREGTQNMGAPVKREVVATATAMAAADLPRTFPVKKPGELSAVEQCRKDAETFANAQVSEKKRKSCQVDTATDGDEAGRSAAKKQRGGAVDGDSDDAGTADIERPEDISHRKYQKRLQKNRNSAYVSRIRRREYTRILEEALEEKETKSAESASAYNTLRHQYDVVVAELKALRESTKARVGGMARAVVRPVGEAASSAATSSTAVVTMFMFVIMFGVLLPDLRQSANFSGTQYRTRGSASHPVVTSVVGGTMSQPSGDGSVPRGSARKQRQRGLKYSATHMDLDAGYVDGSHAFIAANSSEASSEDHRSDLKDESVLPMGLSEAKSADGRVPHGAVSSISHGLATGDHGRIWGSSLVVGDDDLADETPDLCDEEETSDDVEEDVYSEPSSCPTMVDMDGDLALDAEPATKQRLMSQLEKNATTLFGPVNALQVMQLVERKVQDGIVTTQALAILTKKSAAAVAEGMPTGTSLVDTKRPVKREIKEEASLTESSISTVVGNEPLVPCQEDLSVPQSFATFLHKLSVVADDRFVAEIGALIAYRLIPSESNSKLSA